MTNKFKRIKKNLTPLAAALLISPATHNISAVEVSSSKTYSESESNDSLVSKSEALQNVGIGGVSGALLSFVLNFGISMLSSKEEKQNTQEKQGNKNIIYCANSSLMPILGSVFALNWLPNRSGTQVDIVKPVAPKPITTMTDSKPKPTDKSGDKDPSMDSYNKAIKNLRDSAKKFIVYLVRVRALRIPEDSTIKGSDIEKQIDEIQSKVFKGYAAVSADIFNMINDSREAFRQDNKKRVDIEKQAYNTLIKGVFLSFSNAEEIKGFTNRLYIAIDKLRIIDAEIKKKSQGNKPVDKDNK